ncbi:MAG: tetratricopeptide repeat protein [Treponema sp.]|nr:tetratricopeptide repeat protein [Treponema sp.]
MKKVCFSVLLWVSAGVLGFGQTNFSKGEELFMQNKPAEAAVFLENSINEDPGEVKAFLYLGIVYEQTGKTDEAIAVYRQVLANAGDLTANVANNLGNAYFKKGSVSDAESMYTKAIEADGAYASAYLGRANARVKRGLMRDAVTDYEQYLLLEPRSPQRPAIDRLVSFVKAEFAEAERKRLVAEEAARAEAERRQRLLDEVSASLQSAAGASQGLSTGAEDVEGYEGEFELQ